MEGMGLKLTDEASLRFSECVLAYGWHFLDSQLVQTVLMEGITHLWLPNLSTTHPTPFLPTHPLICATCDITMAVLFKIQQCQIASRNSYKTLAKRLFQLHSVSSMATVSHKKATVASLFEIDISQNIKRGNLVSFPKSGHIQIAGY